MERDRMMTIHFNDGSKISFDFPEQAPNAAARQIKLAEFMSSQHVVVEADASILIFPVANIKYIAMAGPMAVAFKGTALPKHAIVGARIVN